MNKFNICIARVPYGNAHPRITIIQLKIKYHAPVEQYTRLQASQGDKDSEMAALRSSQQELDALQAKVRIGYIDRTLSTCIVY